METKVCIICGHELPLEQFPTNRRMPDGHLGWCYECFALREYKGNAKAVEVAPEEPERKQWIPSKDFIRIKEIEAKGGDITADERRERRLAYMREYSRRRYLANKEKHQAATRAWRESERGQAWKKKNNRERYLRFKNSPKYPEYLRKKNEQARLLRARRRLEKQQEQEQHHEKE